MKVGIIGAGAAGMVAAITAARKGINVTLIEGNDRIGKKILMTGNGKCNLTNIDLSYDNYYCDDKDLLDKLFSRFNQFDAINFFSGIGLISKNKNGYIYPLSEQASTVLDALRFEINSLNISLVTNYKVIDIYTNENFEYVVSDGNKEYIFDRIIISTGGLSAPKTGSDGSGLKLAENFGHNIKATVPALCGLKCKEKFFKSIAGVRATGNIELLIDGKPFASEKGEIQFTDYGISGIPVFQLSRIANYALLKGKDIKAKISLIDLEENEFNNIINSRVLLLNDRTVEEFFNGLLNKKLMNLFISLNDVAPNAKIEDVPKDKLTKIFDLCKNFTVTIKGSNGYEQSQVTAGGVAFDEVDENLQSKYFPGLYFAGEILDIDGYCGGYNLQWAWTSGFIAGHSIAE